MDLCRSQSKKLLALLAISLLAFLYSGAVSAATYYVRTTGDNANDGLSPESAWRGIDKVNTIRLEAGDSVLFEGGYTFAGNLYLDAEDRGTRNNPITIGSFGNGRATINAGMEAGLYAYNTAGVIVRDLNFVGAGPRQNVKNGVTFLNDLPGNVRLSGITISNVNISGFGHCGISIAGWNNSAGFADVRIIHVAAFDNLDAGISTVAQSPKAHANVYIGYSKAFRNFGNPELGKNTGNGIIMGGVEGGMIERCVAYSNGKNNVTGGEGGVGIWTYDSARVIIQYNESHSNQTSGRTDGGGFDLDNNVQDSVLQFNYSHNNDGSGLLIGTDAGNTGNVIRYNISHNDGRKNGYPGMFVYGPISNADIYNNTVILQQSNAPPALLVQNGPRNIRFRNNIFYSANGGRLVHILPGHSDLVFQNNCYHAANGNFRIVQDGMDFSSLSAWQAATGHEMLNGQRIGFDSDPQFINISEAIQLNDATALNTLTGYKLSKSSPLLGQGLNLNSLFGVNTGTRDFFSTAPGAQRFNLGAHTFSGASGNPSIAFQNSDGRLAVWKMNGVNFEQAQVLREGTPINSSRWRAFSTTDINNDGSSDVIFQDVNGTVAAWLMDGNSYIQAVALRPGENPEQGWKAVAMADVNKDSHADVLFQNSSAQVLAWLMNETEFTGQTLLFGGDSPGTGWRVVGAGDFNHDGSNDILFQHGDGRLEVWLLDGAQRIGIQPLRSAAPPSIWRIVGVEDLDQDGSLDIIWRHANGQLAAWMMNQTQFLRSALIRNGQPVAPHWRVIGPR